MEIETLRDKLSIVEVIQGSGHELHPKGNTWKGLCPFHDDTKPSLDVDPARARFRCWACNAHGDVLDWIAWQTVGSFARDLKGDERFADVLKAACEQAGVDYEREFAKRDTEATYERKRRQGTLEAYVRAAEKRLGDRFDDLGWLQKGKPYLTRNVCRRWRLGLAPVKSELKRFKNLTSDRLKDVGLMRSDDKLYYLHHLIIPFIERGQVVFLTSRRLRDEYLDGREVQVSKALHLPVRPGLAKPHIFNADALAPASKGQQIIVVEAPLGAICLQETLKVPTVALCSKAVDKASEFILNKLRVA